MKLSVWGLGYVGTVSAGCLAQEGHEVIGVDSEQTKVDLINAGKTPIIEKDIGRIIKQQVAAGRLSATTDATTVVQQTDLFLVCVGTPSRGNGDIELKYVRRVCEQIGTALRNHQGAPVVVIRSTMLPGTMRDVVIPTLAACSRRRRIRGLHQPGVPARGNRRARFLQSAEDRHRRAQPGKRGSAGKSLRPDRSAARPD